MRFSAFPLRAVIPAGARFIPLLMVSSIASANEPLNMARAEVELGEVVVTASKEATAISDTSAAIGVVDAKDLEEKHAEYVFQVLNSVPGVHMVDLGNEQHSMSIRMPISTNAFYQYLEDNVPIRPLGVFNHNALLEVNLAATDRIEVMKGPASSLYGSNAVGGAVNVLTRSPSTTPEATVGLRGSDQGYQRIDVDASTTTGDVGVRVSGYSARNTESWREHNDMRKDSLTLRLDTALGDDSILKSVYSYNRLDSDMPGSLNETDFRSNPGISYQTFTIRDDMAQRFTSTLDTQWSDKVASTVTAWWRDDEHTQNPSYSVASCGSSNKLCLVSSPSRQATGVINNNSYNSLGGDAKLRTDFDAWRTRLIYGVSYDHTPNSYAQDDINIVRQGKIYSSYYLADYSTYSQAQVLKSKRRRYTVDIDNPSTYVQIESSPVDDLRVVAGLRYDYIRYGFNNDLAASGFGAASEVRDFEHLSPKLGVVYRINNDTDLFSNISQGFTPPEVSALYGALNVPSLSPSVFNNIDAGLRYRRNDLQLEATIYELKGKDEILSYSIAQGINEPRNAGRTLHRGVELGANMDITEEWSLNLASTFATHTFDDYQISAISNYAGNTIPGSPKNTSQAEIVWRPAKSVRIGAETEYVSAYWMNNINTVRYEGYAIYHLRASFTQGPLEVYLHGYNLSNKNYSTSATSNYAGGSYNPDIQNSYSPGEPRTAMLGVNYHFGKQSD